MRFRTSRTSLVDVELLYPYSNSWGYGLAIVYYIFKSGSPMPITLIYWNMVLRIQEIKASKRCTKIKIGNHAAGPADRSKTKTCQDQLIQLQLCLHMMNGACDGDGPGNYH